MDQPKIERLLRLMKYLTANVNYTVDDLAEKFDISVRSIYRYIDTFKEAGFVVHKRGEYYSLGKESKYFKQISQLIHFTEEEAYIINKLIDGLDDTNMLKQNLRKKLASVYNCTSLADCIVKGKVAANVNTIIEAIEDKKQVKLCNYASSNTDNIRDRIVEPFDFTTNYISIWCYEPESKMNKIFKTSRIESVLLLNNWENEEKHKKGFIDLFRMSGYNQIPIKLELDVLAHNLILEEYPLSERDLKETNNGTWILYTNFSSLQGVGRFVIGLLDHIKILESDDLKRYIRNFDNTFIKNT